MKDDLLQLYNVSEIFTIGGSGGDATSYDDDIDIEKTDEVAFKGTSLLKQLTSEHIFVMDKCYEAAENKL